MTFGPYTILVDFALISLLLFIGQLIRAKVVFIQRLYLPASLIAGMIGLFLGKYFLDILPFSDKISTYPYMLVVVLFASLFIGNSKKQSLRKVIKEVGDTFTLNMAAEIGGFGFALLIGGSVLSWLFPGVHHSFSLLLPAGFIGGHGYAAAIGETLKEVAGWEEALPIGQTFATIGIICGILGGLVLINIGNRIGATRFIRTMSELPKSMQTGLIPKKEQPILGRETVSPISIDPLTWHILFVLIAALGGYSAHHGIKAIFPQVILPMMSLSMLAGVIVQFILNRLKLSEYVDKHVITRIGSTVTDYLVAFGIASIKITIVIKYAVPILLMVFFGLIFALFFAFIISRRLFRTFWFERSIFIYGWTTGVVAMGVTLLRIVDPEFRSKTLEEYGMAYVFISIIELVLISILPIFVAKGYVLSSSLVLLVIWAVLLIGTAVVYGVHNEPADQLRKGEKEVIDNTER